jgi:hypothetical protein
MCSSSHDGEALRIPEDDRMQCIVEYAREDFELPPGSGDDSRRLRLSEGHSLRRSRPGRRPQRPYRSVLQICRLSCSWKCQTGTGSLPGRYPKRERGECP